jgi:hypothetical protein
MSISENEKILLFVVLGVILFVIGASLLGYGIYKYRENKGKINIIWIVIASAIIIIGIILFILAIIKKSNFIKVK